jgi:hypothetical protein
MQAYLTDPAVILTFLTTFIDEIGEIKDLSWKQIFIICFAFLFIFLVYSKRLGQLPSIPKDASKKSSS